MASWDNKFLIVDYLMSISSACTIRAASCKNASSGECPAQRANDDSTTSAQRRCNVMTLHRRWGDVVLTSYVCWEISAFAVRKQNHWILQNVSMEIKCPAATLHMCRMMWIRTFYACSKAHFRLTRPIWKEYSTIIMQLSVDWTKMQVFQ